VIVHDVDRAVKFYRDVRLMLGIPAEPEFDHASCITYYRVADLEAAYPAPEHPGADVPQGAGAAEGCLRFCR
jgi:hypothetical protein